jgi:hypothetical protein
LEDGNDTSRHGANAIVLLSDVDDDPEPDTKPGVSDQLDFF